MTRRLPDVLSIRRDAEDREHILLDLHIPADIIHFAGHFPGMAILPGVVQIDWAVRFGREHFALNHEFSLLENIKFQSLIVPDARIELALVWNASKRSLEFSFATRQRKYSTGRIVFGAKT